MAEGGPPAGWYPDPENAGQQRYWDGAQWTEHRAPLASQQPAPWSSTGAGQQPGYGSYGAPGYGTSGQAAAQQNQKALWSMILGILGLVCCGVFTAVPATILGHLAKQEIAAAGGRESGSGMAQAGFVMGIIGIALSVLGVVVWIFFVAAGAGGAGFSGGGF